jgi:hypothetical protein
MEMMFHSKDKIVINTTIELERGGVIAFEDWLNENFKLINFKVVADTNQLYEDDPTFRKLVKAVKEAQRIKDLYINEHNHSN